LDSGKREFYDFFRNMSDKNSLIFAEQLTSLKKEQIDFLVKKNNPPSLRILQRILLELI